MFYSDMPECMYSIRLLRNYHNFEDFEPVAEAIRDMEMNQGVCLFDPYILLFQMQSMVHAESD